MLTSIAIADTFENIKIGRKVSVPRGWEKQTADDKPHWTQRVEERQPGSTRKSMKKIYKEAKPVPEVRCSFEDGKVFLENLVEPGSKHHIEYLKTGEFVLKHSPVFTCVNYVDMTTKEG